MDDDDYNIDVDFLRKFTEKYGDVDHPLFMDEIPHDPSENEDLVALQELLAQGETRDTIAEKYKEVGNGYVQQGEYFYEAAISSYTNGIEAQSKNDKLNAALYLNRAFVHLKRKEYVKCVDDCRKSIKLDPTNVKAYYRAAFASHELALYKRALTFCLDYYDISGKGDGGKQQVLDVLKKASVDFANIYKLTLDQLRQRDEKLKSIKKREQELQVKQIKQDRDAIEMLRVNGIFTKNCIYEIPMSQNVVFYHEGGLLHTSCLLIYDEYNITDYIENMDYSTTIGEHLDVMFTDPTDERSFNRNNARCFYEVSKGEFIEFGTNESMATVIYKTKVAYKVAPVHIVHKDFDIKTLGI